MNYLLTIHHYNIQYQWDINIENGEVYSIPKLNRGMLSPTVAQFAKILMDSKEYTRDVLAYQLGVTENRITKLLANFCQTLNTTHCIPNRHRITNQHLLRYLKNSTLQVEMKRLPSFNFENIQSIKSVAILKNGLEGRANQHLHSIFNLLSETLNRNKEENYTPFFLTNNGRRLPFIYLEYQNKCPLHFPLNIEKEVYEEQKIDSLFNQRFNSGRNLYNGNIFCLRNKDSVYSLGKTNYSSILDSCDYISSKIKEYWMQSYENYLFDNLYQYLSDGLDKIFESKKKVDTLLDTSIHKKPQRDGCGIMIKQYKGKGIRLSIALTNEIRDIVKTDLTSILHEYIITEIYNSSQDGELGEIIKLWKKRMIDVHKNNFSNYIAGLAFSIPLFQVTKSGLTVLLAKGSQQKAVGSGTKHVVPAGMMEFFSETDPELFSFDDFKALVCKELLEELYFGNNIVHKHTSQYSQIINLFSDNQNERTYVTYEDILTNIKEIIIPKWDNIWEEYGKTKENIPSKVLLEKVLEFQEMDEPYFMIVDTLNSRPEIIKPIYFTEDIEVFLNWENTSIARVSFSNQEELENFIKESHRDFCAPGIASIYLGSRYYFENQQKINQSLGL